MDDPIIRPAFTSWPRINRRLRDAVGGLTDEQLARRRSPDRWPLWAIVGHAACQRVFWLCDFAGEPGARETPFPDAAWMCPGDDDLDHPLAGPELAAALDATFAIVEGCLDRWTLGSLREEIRRPEFGPDWIMSRGGVIQRVFAHDIAHAAEANEVLGAAGLPLVDLWDGARAD